MEQEFLPATTPEQRACEVLESSATEQYLRGLSEQYTSITEVKDKAGRTQAHQAAMTLMQARLSVERAADEALTDAKRFITSVKSECGRLVAIVQPEEKRLKAVRDVWDAEREAEAAAKRAYVESMRVRIAEVRNMGQQAMQCETSADVAVIIQAIQAVDVASFNEFEADAVYACEDAHDVSVAAHARLLNAEQKAQEIEAERQALLAQRAELAAQRAELERMMKAMQEPEPEDQPCSEAEPQPTVAAEESAAPVIDEPAEPSAPDANPLIDLVEINTRISPISITVDGLAQLGFTPAATDKASRLYHAADLPLILAAMVRHLNGVVVGLLRAV